MLHPNTGEVHVMQDSDEMTLNLFRVGDVHAPNWHCVYSRDAHRFSLGMKLKDEDVYRILVRTGNARPDAASMRQDANFWRRNGNEKESRVPAKTQGGRMCGKELT